LKEFFKWRKQKRTKYNKKDGRSEITALGDPNYHSSSLARGADGGVKWKKELKKKKKVITVGL
jgi:hypothetical protein